MNRRRRLGWLLAIILFLAGGAAVVLFHNTTPLQVKSQDLPDSVLFTENGGTNPIVMANDPFLVNEISPRVADAIRWCPRTKADAYVTILGRPDFVDAKLVPCIKRTVTVTLSRDTITNDATYAGLKFSNTAIHPTDANGVHTFIRTYSHTPPVKGDRIFAALVETRTIGYNNWRDRNHSIDLGGNSPRGYLDYQEYRIVLYLYDEASALEPGIDTGVNWSDYMNSILATSDTVSY